MLAIARESWPAQLVALADREMLASRAAAIPGLAAVTLHDFDPDATPAPHTPGHLPVLHTPLARPAAPGRLDPANAAAVLATLDAAVDSCRDGRFDAMVTAPVQKSVIADAGFAFRGHTEYLAARCGVERVVMLLVAGGLRVALATTHLPLAAVPAAITRELLGDTLGILDGDLRRRFGLPRPRIAVLGLNPHAGEGGHLGREELDVIIPVLEALRAEGLDLTGPLPADTAFTPRALADVDAVLALYHDQGLPVLKHAGFGEAVNVTLGLPIVRTSVDHGTALDLAGTGRADAGSLRAAVTLAVALARPL
ncbi:4-hydroxythreonine-4-phosphate dehydrogenase [Pseudohaliea rubra DSM 19751]|uniref:4-hydroxythreonine-4-phosphate dehydrogenase n=1 Tax=Pseudohaliea rubra DSM 19751 TaxID=1265313 RepID=A0A095VNU1_9GAMM|nr:4-hydroxythreonine-4-phosphate dehydrogenase [Pseudohaliea rubra DSM 19751]